MIGAFKCCGSGARMLRSTSSTGVSTSALDSSQFGIGSCSFRDCERKSLPFSNLNWSQKRFLRGQAPTSFQGNVNSRFVVKEIEGRMKSKGSGSSCKGSSLSAEKELRKHSRSIRDHQSLLLAATANSANRDLDLIAEAFRVITEGSSAARIKNRKDEALLKEWISIQNELRFIKKDRIEEYKRKFQIAGQQALREMEANLKKASSLDELDQAIEGALCSEVKREYTQKSLHDN